ncbi:MAG: hypothetical protein QOH95_2834 [Gaiellaceae bacterium]|nr:hypothetical protein [Gaiellaceae bacterium]
MSSGALPTSRFGRRSLTRGRALLRDATPAEALIALMIVLALWPPPVLNGKAWTAPGLLLVLLAAWHAIRERRLPPLPVALVAYVAVYAVAAIHGGALGETDVARFFVRPLLGVAVAALLVLPAQRFRMLVLVVAAALAEVPVTLVQTIQNVVHYGRDATLGADNVTGTLGASQAGVLTLVAVLATCLVVSAWLAGTLRGRYATVLAVLLSAIGVFSSTRALFVFLLVAAVGLVVGVLLAARGHAPGRRLAVVLAGAVLATPLSYLATRAIYPDAYKGVLSSQRVDVLGGAAAQGVPTPTPPRVSRVPSVKQTPPPTVAPVPPPSGVQLLPGRFAQLRLARSLSLHDGPVTALIGRGLGASTLDPSYTLAQQVPLPQRTGSTWVSLVLTESGWLGLAAFAGLLAWLILLAIRLRRAATDLAGAVLAIGLPSIAALTAVGAVFTTILDVRAYATVFWVVVGVAVSSEARRPASVLAGARGRTR